MSKKYLTYSLLGIIFTLSILIRIPYIKNTVDYCEKGNIILLTNLAVWHEEGASAHAFLPVLTWFGNENKYVSVYKRLEDKIGNNYFVSFPPFVFILVYWVSFIVPAFYWPVMLHFLALILHLGICFTGYLIMRKYILPEKSIYYSIFIFIVLAFAPPLLFHGLYVFPGLLVLFFLMCLVYFFKKEQLKQSITLGRRICLFLLFFLVLYTDWVGFFVALSTLIYILKNKQRVYLRSYISILLLAFIVAYGLFLFQLVSLVSFKEVLTSLGIRFMERSGWFTQQYTDQGLNFINSQSYSYLLVLLNKTLMPFGYLFIILFFGALRKGRLKKHNLNLLWVLVLIPVLLYSVVFFNSTIIHLGEWAKWAIPIAFALILLLVEFSVIEKGNRYLLIVLTMGLMGLSGYTYNSYMSERSLTANHQVVMMSNYIKSNTKTSQVVIVKKDSSLTDMYSLLEFDLKRNIAIANSIDDAENLLKKIKRDSAVFFTFDIQQGAYTIQTINLKND